jgi:hypothetical protein
MKKTWFAKHCCYTNEHQKANVRVKYSSFLAILTLCFPLLVFSQGEPIVIHHFENTSCGAWTKSELVRAQYLHWFRGFISGYNFAKPHAQVGLNAMPDFNTLSLYIDKHCRENPLKPFTAAALKLARELAPNKEIGPTR